MSGMRTWAALQAGIVDGVIGGPAFEMSEAPRVARMRREYPDVKELTQRHPNEDPAVIAEVAEVIAAARARDEAEAIAATATVAATTAPVSDDRAADHVIPAPRAFVVAGAAVFTLVGMNARYTFKVSKRDAKPGSAYTSPAWFVSLLTGPDNVNDYTYVGLLDTRTGQIRLTAKSTYRADSVPAKAFNWTIGRIWRGVSVAPATIVHCGRCGRCGRLLTVPASVETGFGPECAGKLGE